MKRSNLFRGLNFQWRQDAADVKLVDGVSSNRFGLGEPLVMREMELGDMVKIYWKIYVNISAKQRCQDTNYVREIS